MVERRDAESFLIEANWSEKTESPNTIDFALHIKASLTVCRKHVVGVGFAKEAANLSAAGSLAGGFVSSSRISAGDGAGGTEKMQGGSTHPPASHTGGANGRAITFDSLPPLPVLRERDG